MRSTFKILPYINRKRIKSDGTTAVLCRVSIDGKSILITTGIFCVRRIGTARREPSASPARTTASQNSA